MIRHRRLVSAALLATLPIAAFACGGDDKTGGSSEKTSSKPIETNQMLLATTPGKGTTGGKRPKPTKSVRVKSGDVVQLVTTVPKQNLPGGAKLKITLAKGPGRRLKTSAGGAGGDPTSTATISASGGKEISIQAVRYGCALPPTPTFCPIESKRSGEGWELLMDPPSQGPVALSMLVKAG